MTWARFSIRRLAPAQPLLPETILSERKADSKSQTIAKLADVAYDGRRGKEYPEQSDPEEYGKEMKIIANGKLDFSAVGVTAEDVKEYDRQT